MRQAESQHPNPIICPLVKDCTNIKNIRSFHLPISNSEEPKKQTGKSKSDLYWNPKTGEAYSVPKKGGEPEHVADVEPRK